MTIVFVHGIFSSCEVFADLKEFLTAQTAEDLTFLDFNYPYRESLLSNAERLNEFLSQEVAAREQVSIIAHSMGGLVSRLALLIETHERPYYVRYLIMLGTPNHGAIKMSQIKGILGLIKTTVTKIKPIYSMCAGLDNLTKVNTIFNDLFEQDETSISRTKGVDYVTIPGTKYDAENPFMAPSGKKLNSALLGVLALFSWNRGAVQLGYPHDGIVEEQSVRMVVDEGGTNNERRRYSSDEGRKELGRCANVHVIHPAFRKSDHVSIYNNDKVRLLLISLLQTGGIDQWMESLSKDEKNTIELRTGN